MSSELRRKRRVGPLVKLWNMPHTKAIPVGIVGGGFRRWTGNVVEQASVLESVSLHRRRRNETTAAARSFIKAALMGGSRGGRERERERERETHFD